MSSIKCIVIALSLTFCIVISSTFCADLNGWIKGDACWVVEEPSTDSKIVGIIKKKAAVTVEDAGKGWLKIIFAPVRDPQTGKWVECKRCYIQKKDFSVV